MQVKDTWSVALLVLIMQNPNNPVEALCAAARKLKLLALDASLVGDVVRAGVIPPLMHAMNATSAELRMLACTALMDILMAVSRTAEQGVLVRIWEDSGGIDFGTLYASTQLQLMRL
jgi:aspartate carbamoyltransferase catalytic subunit